ncbi:hypothetical protein MMC13_004911 [Lambiella insularis]|nr:hypothetical protein [Lambiella insularis]
MEISTSTLLGNDNIRHPSRPVFRFFDLPAELRNKVLTYELHVNKVIDIDFDNSRRLFLFLVSKQVHNEAAAVFYGRNTFRLFPTQGRVDAQKMKPLIARFPPHYRADLVSLELRLGPFWTKPPACWKVTDTLGLKDADGVRLLKVFVEIDPSQPVFIGFRIGKNFYTNFAGSLLRQVIYDLPRLEEIQFDKYPSVSPEGQLVTRLMNEAKAGGKRVTWAAEKLSCPVLKATLTHQAKAVSTWQI